MSRELARLAAACVLPGFAGLEPPDWIRRLLQEGLGGVVLFARNVRDEEQVASLTAALRAERAEVLVATDEEGGDVTRLEASRGSSYPGSLALGVVDDVALTGEVAAAIAGDLARAGINLNFAPVADVNSNPLNPVIGVRSFGADPELVARHVAAFVAGTQRQGIAASAKHFPGHGDTSADSHLELPTAVGELTPFRAAVRAGAQAVMIGHLRVPALDEGPATLSRAVVTGLLREELGFGGLVVSDALEMRGLSGAVSLEEAAVGAVAAGVDALCLGHDLGEAEVDAVRGALVDAVRSGALAEERLAAAAASVARTAEWARSPSALGAPDGAVGAEAARRAVRASGPVALDGSPYVVELVPEANVAAGEASHGLLEEVRSHRPEAAGERLREAFDLEPLLARVGERPLVLVVRDAARHAWQRAAAEALVTARPDAVVVETGWPGGPAHVLTHGAGRANLAAAAELLTRA